MADVRDPDDELDARREIAEAKSREPDGYSVMECPDCCFCRECDWCFGETCERCGGTGCVEWKP